MRRIKKESNKIFKMKRKKDISLVVWSLISIKGVSLKRKQAIMEA